MIDVIYTGVGSRETPIPILDVMYSLGTELAKLGFVLRSGNAHGADINFEIGCDKVKGRKEIYLKQQATQESMRMAEKYHKAWHKCSFKAKQLHGRNPFQVLGKNLNDPSHFLICWTPDGCIHHNTRSVITGGTGTAISIASVNNVPVYNLKRLDHLKIWLQWINISDKELKILKITQIIKNENRIRRK